MTTDVKFCVVASCFLLIGWNLKEEDSEDTSNIAADKVTRNQFDTQFRILKITFTVLMLHTPVNCTVQTVSGTFVVMTY